MNRFKTWMRPTQCPMQGGARSHPLAVASTLVAPAVIRGWSALPARGIPANMRHRFENLFLIFSAAFALFAGGCLGAAALRKFGLY